MKKHFFLFLLVFLFNSLLFSQMTDSLWKCAYATWDEQPNATGYNTAAVGVLKPDAFVALVNRPSNFTCYLVGYRNATDSTGRLGYYKYGTTGIGGYRQKWMSGLDELELLNAYDVATSNDTLVYVANNDTVGRNIAVFALGKDSVYSTDYRMETGAGAIFGIDADQNGKIYVTKEGSETTQGKVLIYKSISEDLGWALTHTTAPELTITMPEPGFIRALAADKFGRFFYAANYTNGKVYCYVKDGGGAYTLNLGFNLTIFDSISATLRGRPLSMKFMPDKNLLLVASHSLLAASAGYPYGKIYVVNPNTGAVLSKIDCAAWNFMMTGSYSARGSNGMQPAVSGYTSPYSVDVDNQYNVYSVSYYGWTVDKWVYQGTLPTIPLTITDVRETTFMPNEFSLAQNYPNPFNPTTVINYSIPQKESFVTLKVYDVLGNTIATLVNEAKAPGNYQAVWNAAGQSSGVYYYSLSAGSTTLTKKMMLIK